MVKRCQRSAMLRRRANSTTTIPLVRSPAASRFCCIMMPTALPAPALLPPRFREPLCFGALELPSRLNLAPLAGYTNRPFRQTVRELGGVGLATTDLVNARAVLEQTPKTMELLATCPADRPWAVQLFGSRSDEMRAAAQWVRDYGATVIDINMGCPVRKVVKGGGGSAMMCDRTRTIDLVAGIVAAVDCPVTVKMRLGWDQSDLSAPYFAREFEKVGVAAITIHGRFRSQGFSGNVHLDGIKAVVDAVHRIPVIGNGDIRTVADAARMLSETGCAGLAMGRGALANPWIFRQLHRWLASGDPGPRGTYEERLAFLVRHLYRLVEWRGEWHGCIQFRKIGTWYSKALRTGKAIQQKFVRLDSIQMFDEIVEYLRERGAPPGWDQHDAHHAIAVPSGPMAHW